MARTRYLKPGFYQNDRLCELGPWHRLLFAGLWLIADRAGRLEDRPRRIKGEVFPYDEIDVDALLSDLSAGDDPFVIRYEVNGVRYLALPKWSLHQKPHSNEADSAIPSHRTAKKTEVKTEFEPKPTSVPTKAVTSNDLNENSNENSNGEWGMGNGDSNGEAADAAPAPVRRQYGGPIFGGHKGHGWCNQRGLCLPGDLYVELLGRLGGEDRRKEFNAWLGSVIDGLGDAVPGESIWDFWRNHFGRWQGSATTRPQAGKDTAGVRLAKVGADYLRGEGITARPERPLPMRPQRQIAGGE